jgi:tetratricopeptide (TPR) repeat protein
MKRFLLLVIIASTPVVFYAEEKANVDSHILTIKAEQQEAADKGDMEQLKEISSKLERLSTFGDKEWLVNYYLALNYYRISIILYDNKEESEKYLESSKEVIQKSIESKNDFADSHTLFASILGMEIGFKPNLGMTNGMKSAQELEKAKKLAPSNPRVYMVEGTSKLYTPVMFGGGVDKAIALFEKSEELFGKEKDRGIYPDWGNDEIYVWLGNAYKEKEEDSTAIRFYKKALEVNPDYGWAKHLLAEFEQEAEKEE